MNVTTQPKLLKLPAVLARTGLSRAMVYRLMGAGDFPRSVHLSARSVAWVESEVHDWISSRIQETRKKGAA